MIKELTCIGCPMGCALSVDINGDNMTVTGNTCKRGADYAIKELTNPTRIVTSSVRVMGGELDCVSVKTAADIPKDKIFDCMRELKNIEVKAPVKIGDVIVENIAKTGIAIVATKNVR